LIRRLFCIGQWRGFGPVAVFINLALSVRRKLFEFLFSRDLLLDQVSLVTIEWIVVLLPPFDLACWNVTLIIMFGVTFAPIRFRFNQDCAAAAGMP
jgi:hypothetical protein